MLPEPCEAVATVEIRGRRHQKKREAQELASGWFPLGPLSDLPLCLSP